MYILDQLSTGCYSVSVAHICDIVCIKKTTKCMATNLFSGCWTMIGDVYKTCKQTWWHT